MHVSKAELLARHQREVEQLDQKLAVLESLPRDLPLLDRAEVTPKKIWGSEGMIRFRNPSTADGLGIAQMLSPAEKIVKFRTGLITAYMSAASGDGPRGLSIERVNIGSVVYTMPASRPKAGELIWLFRNWWIILDWDNPPWSVSKMVGRREVATPTRFIPFPGMLSVEETIYLPNHDPLMVGAWTVLFKHGIVPTDAFGN